MATGSQDPVSSTTPQQHLPTTSADFLPTGEIKTQKNPHARHFSARNSGARNGCANFAGAWFFFVHSAGKSPMPIKFLV